MERNCRRLGVWKKFVPAHKHQHEKATTCNLGSIMLGGHCSTSFCAYAIIACAFVPTHTVMLSGWNKLFLPDFRLYAVEREQATPPAR